MDRYFWHILTISKGAGLRCLATRTGIQGGFGVGKLVNSLMFSDDFQN